MKTLHTTLAIAVSTLLICCLLGLFFINYLPPANATNLLSIDIETLKGFIEIICILLGITAIVLFTKHIINAVSGKNKQYYDLFEQNPTPMVIVEKDTQRFLAVNKASLECYGYSAEESLRLKVSDIWIDNHSDTTGLNKSGGAYGIKNDGIRKHRKKNGEIITAEVSSTSVVFKGKNCKLFLAHDITDIVKAREDKRIAEEESLNQKKFTAYVLENFPVDVAIFDKDHRYILINKVAVKNDEMRQWMIGKDDFEYFERKGLGDSIAKLRREKFNKAVAGENAEWIDEHSVNGEKRYILRKFYPYREDSELKYVYGYGMDITEVRKAQLQKDEYLKQLEKIAFATSHKIRQPICNIQGLISLLEDGKFDQVELANIIECMSSSSQILDELTRDLAIKLHEYKQMLSSNKVEVLD